MPLGFSFTSPSDRMSFCSLLPWRFRGGGSSFHIWIRIGSFHSFSSDIVHDRLAPRCFPSRPSLFVLACRWSFGLLLRLLLTIKSIETALCSIAHAYVVIASSSSPYKARVYSRRRRDSTARASRHSSRPRTPCPAAPPSTALPGHSLPQT